jgi:tryptophan-rich sensory protein
MGCALFFIWQEQIKNTDEKRGKDILLALKIFFFQLLLNIFWSIIFFGFRSPDLAFFEILILWLTILLSIFAFYKIKKISAYFLVPYILWVTFAGYLNYLIWMLNY